jgi:hypothetical protein
MLGAFLISVALSVSDPPKVSPADIARFRSAFSSWVLDYDSTRVRAAFMIRHFKKLANGDIRTELVFCVQANARNPMGEYSYRWYMMLDGTAPAEMLRLNNQLAQETCESFATKPASEMYDNHDYAADFAPGHVKSE